MSDVIHANNVILGFLEPGHSRETYQPFSDSDPLSRDHAVGAAMDYGTTLYQTPRLGTEAQARHSGGQSHRLGNC